MTCATVRCSCSARRFSGTAAHPASSLSLLSLVAASPSRSGVPQGAARQGRGEAQGGRRRCQDPSAAQRTSAAAAAQYVTPSSSHIRLTAFPPVLVSLSPPAVNSPQRIVAEAKVPKATDAAKHKPGGGHVEICQPLIVLHDPSLRFSPLQLASPNTSVLSAVNEPVKVVASPKIPKATDAAKHKPGGGNVEICQLSQRFTARHRATLSTPHPPVISSLPTFASGVAVNEPVKIVASPKIPKATDAAKHKPGGGNVEICHIPRIHNTHPPHPQAAPHCAQPLITVPLPLCSASR